MTAAADRLAVLSANPFFGTLSETDLATIAPLLREVAISPGEFLLREGDRAVEIFVIDEGEVQILKRDPIDGCLQEITRLGPGESVGELALIDDAPRSASVRAVRTTRLYALAVSDMLSDLDGRVALRTRLTRAVTRRLRDTNEVTAHALALQVAMARFLTFIIFLLSLYAYALSALTHVATLTSSTTPITLGLMLALIGASLAMMRRLGYPLSFYGLTTTNWRRALAEGVLLTVPACAVVVAAKWVLVRVVWGLPDAPILEPETALNLGGLPLEGRTATLLAMAGLYVLHAPLQEFLVRGGLQSPLQRFLAGTGGPWLPILASNVIFSAFHLYLSLPFAVLTFIPGLFWGWLYARHGTLTGVAASHILLGLWTVFMVGIEGMLR